eukprot:TRINITY_DN32076_c0_g1_i1.p1 TRINITY_DN32076_c0_g1~~TRINITY_DN32076_c0_g1_i1.p1  ORF type:complete len:279 (+),score=59.85 TRINITY_DN32076_c0_g1_i1:76-912(+)
MAANRLGLAHGLRMAVRRGVGRRKPVKAKEEMVVQQVLASGQKWAREATHGKDVAGRVDTVISLYARHGGQDLETMRLAHIAPFRASATDHALQAAELAQMDGGDDETIVAALMHDCGHLLAHSMPQLGWGPDKAMRHGLLGDKWLRQLGFSDTVTSLIAHQSNARRYLCFKQKGYFDSLNKDAKDALLLFGGSMSSDEAAIFEGARGFEKAIRLKQICDEAAMRPKSALGDLEQHRALLESHLLEHGTARCFYQSCELPYSAPAEPRNQLWAFGMLH